MSPAAMLAELLNRADWVTVGVVVAYWIRWEVWASGHRRAHEVLTVAQNEVR